MTSFYERSNFPTPSRRTFLQASSLALAGGLMAGTFPGARAAHAGGNEQIKIGLVGCGKRGAGAAANALRTKGDVKLVAVGDVFGDNVDTKLRHLAKEFDESRLEVPEERRFVGLDAYQKVLDCDIDLVILATPPGFRPLHFDAAVKAGKHVFMEKPVAVDSVGVRSVLAAAEEAKRKSLAVGVGLQRHHHTGYVETVKRLQDGAIGDIFTARAYWNMGSHWVRPRQADQSEMEYQLRNWYYFNWLCGDHIVEQHVHNLDVINWVKNAHPISAHGFGGRQVRTGKEHGEIFDHHTVEYTYADGTKLFSQCRQIDGCMNLVAEFVQGTKGRADLANQRIELADGSEPWRFREKVKNPYQREWDDLVESIRLSSPINEAESAATSTMTAILGRMCTYSGQEFAWDEALYSSISLQPAAMESIDFASAPPTLPDADGFYPSAVPGVTKVL